MIKNCYDGMKISILVILFFLYLACNGQHDSATSAKENNNKGIAEKNVAQPTGPKKPLKSLLDSLRIDSKTIKIVIVKSKYELSVWAGSLKLKTYPVVFGLNPVDDKLMQGDKCTPEGLFKIKSKYPHASWSKFIWIDYPIAESWKKHNEAIRKGLIPKSAKIGGEVGIHGVPKGCDYAIDNRQNWTFGCISLKNKDVNEIYEVVRVGTEIEIKK
jgi:murein L,D-transpeptidase YafK